MGTNDNAQGASESPQPNLSLHLWRPITEQQFVGLISNVYIDAEMNGFTVEAKTIELEAPGWMVGSKSEAYATIWSSAGVGGWSPQLLVLEGSGRTDTRRPVCFQAV